MGAHVTVVHERKRVLIYVDFIQRHSTPQKIIRDATPPPATPQPAPWAARASRRCASTRALTLDVALVAAKRGGAARNPVYREFHSPHRHPRMHLHPPLPFPSHCPRTRPGRCDEGQLDEGYGWYKPQCDSTVQFSHRFKTSYTISMRPVSPAQAMQGCSMRSEAHS